MFETIVLYRNRRSIGVAITSITMTLAGFAPLPSRADLETGLPSIDTTAQQLHAREIFRLAYDRRSFLASGVSKQKLSRALLSLVRDALPEKQRHTAATITRTIIEESHLHHMDPFFIFATIQTESGFNAKAVGTHGEIGLMQIRPKTAAWVLEKNKRHTRLKLTNPRQNIQIGVAYFSVLRRQFSKDSSAYITAYNMGPKNLRKLLGLRMSPREYHDRILSKYQQVYENLNGLLANSRPGQKLAGF